MRTVYVTFRPAEYTGPLNQELVEIPDDGTANDAKKIVEFKYEDVVAIHVSETFDPDLLIFRPYRQLPESGKMLMKKMIADWGISGEGTKWHDPSLKTLI